MYSKKVFLRYTASAAAKRKFFKIFSIRSRKTIDEGRSYLMVMTDRREQSDAEMSEKMKKKSSLTSLRKDNEVKLEIRNSL